MSRPWEFRWYRNDLPHPSTIGEHHIHVVFSNCNISELYHTSEKDGYVTKRYTFPAWIEYLDLSYNTIYDFFEGQTVDFPLPGALEILNVSHNKLNCLPDALPSNMIGLHARNNFIEYLPQHLPPKMKFIQATQNRIYYFNPKETPELVKFLASNNRLQKIEWENWGNHIQVIDISNNLMKEVTVLPEGLVELRARGNYLKKLPKLPDTLKILDVSENEIEEIQPYPKSLQSLNVAKNVLKVLDESILECTGLEELDYSGNPKCIVSVKILDMIEQLFRHRWLSGARQKNIQAFQKGETRQLNAIYDDSQNVHLMEESLVENVKRLVYGHPEWEEWVPKTVDDLLLEAEAWNVEEDVRKIIQDEWDYRSTSFPIEVSVGDVWKHAWGRIRRMTSNNRSGILGILATDVTETSNVCFTGRIGRICGILQGFDDDMKIELSLPEKVAMRYSTITKRLEKYSLPEDSLTYLWELLCQFALELVELGMNTEKRDEWLTSIREQIYGEVERIGEQGWDIFWTSWVPIAPGSIPKKVLFCQTFKDKYQWLEKFIPKLDKVPDEEASSEETPVIEAEPKEEEAEEGEGNTENKGKKKQRRGKRGKRGGQKKKLQSQGKK